MKVILLVLLVLIRPEQIYYLMEHEDTSYYNCEHVHEQKSMAVRRVPNVVADIWRDEFIIETAFNNLNYLNYGEKYWLIQELMPYVVEYLKRIFKVHSSRRYDLSSFDGACMRMQVPSEYRRVGEYDMLLLVNVEKVPKVKRLMVENRFFYEDSKRLMTGGFCGVSESNNRPVVAELSVNYDLLNKMSHGTTTSFEKIVVETLHQIIHVMGFSQYAFEYYVDPATGSTLPRDQIIKESFLRGKKVQLVVLPKVVEAVRSHFSCDDLEGLELEDEGGENIKDNHWERRVAEEDIMMGITDHLQGLSNYTIGLLEGTGWYQSKNFQWAHRIQQGKKYGCAFVKEKCVQKVDGKYKTMFDYYCGEVGASQAVSGSEKQCGTCGWRRMVEYDHYTPQAFDYYENKMTLQTPLNDNCPQTTNFQHRKCTFPDNMNKNEFNSPVYDEYYGPDSVCVKGNWVLFYGNHEDHASCLRATCEGGNKVRLTIGEKVYSVLCETSHETIVMEAGSLFKGHVQCPDIEKVCNTYSVNNYQTFVNKTFYPYMNFVKEEEKRREALANGYLTTIGLLVIILVMFM